jgi:MFS family permease
MAATHWTRLRTWLGLEPNILVMLGCVLILGTGEELWQRFVPKYLEVLGAGVGVIAAYGVVKDFLDAVYQYPGGWLADRLGRGAALVVFTLLAMVGYGLYLAAPSWEWVLAGTVFVMAWSSLTLPALFAIIGDNLPPAKRATGFGVLSLLKRIPIIVAPAVGGWLIGRWGLDAGVRAGLVVTLIVAAAAVVFVSRRYVEVTAPLADELSFVGVWRELDPRLKRLLVSDCLARWAEGIPKVFILLYVLDVRRRSGLDFGWLTAIQMGTATAIYLPVAKVADAANRKPFVAVTFACFALFPLLLVLGGGLVGLALAFVVAGLREFGEPARKALIVDLAHESRRGRVVGLYYLVRGLVVCPASLVGGLLWELDADLPFLAAALVGAVGLFAYVTWGPGQAAATLVGADANDVDRKNGR